LFVRRGRRIADRGGLITRSHLINGRAKFVTWHDAKN
jgi:hypothetical protein